MELTSRTFSSSSNTSAVSLGSAGGEGGRSPTMKKNDYEKPVKHVKLAHKQTFIVVNKQTNKQT